jgi:AcrR family transcriptional regulator
MPRTLSPAAHTKILDAATELLRENGIDGFTVEAVAHRSGVAKTTIYRHFDSAHQLVVDAIGCLVSPVATPNTGSLRGDLLELFGRQLPLAADAQLRSMLLGLLVASDADADLAKVLEELQDQRITPVRTVVELARARGELRGDVDVEHAVDLIQGPLFMRAVIRQLPITEHDLVAMVDLIVAGLTG